MYYTSYICHHGVKGMKWGIRHKYKLIGRHKKTSSAKKNAGGHSDTESKKAISSKDIEVMREKASKDAMKKTLAVIGGVALTAAAVYAIKKHYDTSVDKTLKSGVEFQRILKEDSVDLNRAFYTSYKKGDNRKYRGLYGKQLKEGFNIFEGSLGQNNKVNMAKLSASRNLKIASTKSASEIFNNLYSNDTDFRKNAQIQYRLLKGFGKPNPSIKDIYEQFNRTFTDHSPENQKYVDKFYSALKNAGYSGVTDINDQKYSGYNAKSATIIFDTAGISVNSITELDSKRIQKDHAISIGKIAVNAILTSPTFIGPMAYTAGNFGYSFAAQRSFINQYRVEHPNTTKTDKEIIAILNSANSKSSSNKPKK